MEILIKRHIITKILKLDENNQYGFAMTKPMKAKTAPSWLELNLLPKTVDLDEKFGHLFVDNIEFDDKRATE